MRDVWWASMVWAIVAMLSAEGATADANPNFTPKHLVNQADTVLLVEFERAANETGRVPAKVLRVVKGTFEAKSVTVNLKVSPLSKTAVVKLNELLDKGQRQALLFIGQFTDSDDVIQGGQRVYLHLAGEFTGVDQDQWFILKASADWPNEWDVSKSGGSLLKCFSGGTDMLRRCVDAVLADKTAEVPTRWTATWGVQASVVKVTGTVHAAQAVDLAGKNPGTRADLFLAANSGDRLFRYVGDKLVDVTRTLRLASRSQAHAWGDFDGDGTVDLASYDGKRLMLHRQQADGTFVTQSCDTGSALSGTVELAAVDMGRWGRPSLVVTLVGRAAQPVLLTLSPQGQATVAPLGANLLSEKDVGVAAHSVVADLDGDGRLDILLVGTLGSLFYRGQAMGEFQAPVLVRLGCGEGSGTVCLGDFDADGLLDVLTLAVAPAAEKNAPERTSGRVWQNLGDGKFADASRVSGEVFRKPPNSPIVLDTGDFTGDGLADVMLVSGAEHKVQLFLSRGYRSLVGAQGPDLVKLTKADAAHQGFQAGCLGDFTGDGAMDIALVTKNGGEVLLVSPQLDEKTPALTAITVNLPATAGVAGPVNVRAWLGAQPLGAQAVRVGEPGATFGLHRAGPVTLKWKTPDGKDHEKKTTVEAGPSRVTLDGGK